MLALCQVYNQNPTITNTTTASKNIIIINSISTKCIGQYESFSFMSFRHPFFYPKKHKKTKKSVQTKQNKTKQKTKQNNFGWRDRLTELPFWCFFFSFSFCFFFDFFPFMRLLSHHLMLFVSLDPF